jgi:hypothetical protein
VALSTGLLSPLLDSLIAALGGEMAWGAQMSEAAATQANAPAAAPDDPPF